VFDPLPSLRQFFREARTREFLAWCLPALIIGLTLRAVLMVHSPYAFFHDDASDFLVTPDRLINDWKWSVHAKKTFLVPAAFSAPFFLPGPVLITIPLFQHFLGLLLVLVVGLLCRLWFHWWKIFLLPLTVLLAVNPFLLWYEHTIMAETIFVFCTALLALAGTLYAFEQTRARFVFLCAALVLVAGARPEGKLLFGFGLLFVSLLHFRGWRTEWIRPAIVLVLALVIHFQTKTSQAGLLLYTSVCRFTPTELKSAPGFGPYIAPLQNDLQKRWEQRPCFPKVRDRRAVAEAVERYLSDHPKIHTGKSDKRSVDSFCMKLASETCRRNLSYLPVHVYHKFRSVASESPSGLLTNEWLFEKQREAYRGDTERTLRLTKKLTGIAMTSEQELDTFVDRSYGEVPWYNALNDRWLQVVNTLRFPDERYREGSYIHDYPGVPLYFLLGALGMIAVALRRGVLQPFHVTWMLTMFGFFFVIMLTANVRSRFRFVFEPFWFLYIGLLLESVVLLFARFLPRR
jgi:hypothetical protein